MNKMEARISIGLLLVICTAWQAHAAFNCTATGRFADTNDPTCKNYTLCVYNGSTGTYIAYNYTCPTSVFSPTISQCTDPTNYVCNNTNTTSSPSVCTAEGYFADSSSTNCFSYIECVQINGTFTETPYTCPDNTYFNPNTTLCESDYNCHPFHCTAAGRFADTTDTTCQAYFFCVYDSSTTTYIQYNYTCPSTSLFNPNTAVCTSSYTCTN